jgi:hypothetical protein
MQRFFAKPLTQTPRTAKDLEGQPPPTPISSETILGQRFSAWAGWGGGCLVGLVCAGWVHGWVAGDLGLSPPHPLGVGVPPPCGVGWEWGGVGVGMAITDTRSIIH